MTRQDELSRTLKACRQPYGESRTILFEDGSTHVLRPSAAFTGDWRKLAEHVAEGRPYKFQQG